MSARGRLPEGWRLVPLGDVCESATGQRNPGKEPEKTFIYVDISSVDNDQKRIVEPKRLLGIDAPSRARKVIRQGDVIISTTRPNLNAVALVPGELDNQICSTGFCVLRPVSSLIDSAFLFGFVRTEAFVSSLSDLVKGALYPAVTDRQVLTQLIPLPPLPEQQRIAAILDAADALRAKRRAALSKLDALGRAVFLEMFGEPVGNPKGWRIAKLSACFAENREGAKCGPFGSALKHEEYVAEGIPVWTMDNIQGLNFVQEGALYVAENKYNQLSAYSAVTGDIIISRAGTVGKMCVVETEAPRALISTNLIRLSLNEQILDPYFFISLMYFARGNLGRLQTGSDGAYTFMSTGTLKKLTIPVPTSNKQREYRQYWMKQRESSSSIKGALKSMTTLLSSIRELAFRGEL
ncbi:MAG: restriction endonuclease subunit S [Anaerolineae bacterium]|nr:restriction endonuclease subunit S [Anaerolineae bacterium]